ncbi:MAG: ABC transporter ATP-binding protein [Acetobacteraceae bacterium]|nr:ABC transporter ATP-binding protein [Acetobacteraceae bacterium]
MSAELRIEGLDKAFIPGARPAVKDVSFTVGAGEIVVLLGPSGCGKTTTLRCVAGLEHPTAGVIRIGETIVSAPKQGILVPPRSRNIGMVFQSYAVWPHMTVRQNVAYPLKTRKLSGAEADRKVAGALELVGLEDYAHRSVTTLSGGQMQRVALARAVVYEPQLLLLDEPLSNLDAMLRLRLRDDLRKIVKAAGLTALYVTHDQTEAVVLGDRIGVMRDGNMLQMATPQEIYNRPADLFVAGFTGASNVLDGTLSSRDGAYGLVRTNSGDVLRTWIAPTLTVGAAVKLALRPENLRLDAPEGAENRFLATVRQRRYLGTETAYDLAVFGGDIEVREFGTEVRHAVGQAVAISIPQDACWAYAAAAS